MLEYLLIAFIAIFCIQFIYYVFIFGSFSFSKKKSSETNFNLPVSVLICAKNEAKNLTENLPLFLKQNYPNFELVLILNCRGRKFELMEFAKPQYPVHLWYD